MSAGTPALLVLTMWWACETAFRPAARRRFGAELTDGYPRWRVALGCLTQIVIFPLMFLVFVLGRQPWLMESFLLVFGCSLLQDCLRFPRTMGPLLLLHHAACLVGLLVARFGAGPEWRTVFPYFHCGCTALELGSGACNVRPLRRKLSLRVRVGVRVRVRVRVRSTVRVRVMVMVRVRVRMRVWVRWTRGLGRPARWPELRRPLSAPDHASRLPRAPASLGQPVAGCTLAGHAGFGFSVDWFRWPLTPTLT